MLQVQEVGDGNINFVYIVKGPKGALCLKQGLPFVRIAQDWPLTQVPCPDCTRAPALPVGAMPSRFVLSAFLICFPACKSPVVSFLAVLRSASCNAWSVCVS